jgi:hypothetical protein
MGEINKTQIILAGKSRRKKLILRRKGVGGG